MLPLASSQLPCRLRLIPLLINGDLSKSGRVLLVKRLQSCICKVQLGLQLAILVDESVGLLLELPRDLLDVQTGDLLLVTLAYCSVDLLLDGYLLAQVEDLVVQLGDQFLLAAGWQGKREGKGSSRDGGCLLCLEQFLVEFLNFLAEHILSLLVLLNIPLQIFQLSLIIRIDPISTTLQFLNKTLQILAIFLQHLILVGKLDIGSSEVLIMEHELIDTFVVELALVGEFLLHA